MPEILTENTRRPGCYIVGEAADNRSREVILIAGGVANRPLPGTVLGQVTATGKFVPLNVSATDGSQTARAIYYGFGTAAGADLRCAAHVRECSVNGLLLTWPAGITQNQITAAYAQLATYFIIGRT